MATKARSFSIASLALAVASLTAGTEVQLLPLGQFASVDGRPEDVAGGKWVLTPEIGQRVIELAAQQANPFLIDYEHQSLKAADNGLPAPAAGWFSKLEMRADGLWAVGVEWTARAKAMIDAGEYRFASAVFAYDQVTGAVLKLFSAAITNTPGLDGLRELGPVAAASFDFTGLTKKEPSVNPLLKALLTALNLPENTSEETALTAVAALSAQSKKDKDQVAALTAQVATAKDTPDPAKFVPIALLNDANTRLAALSSQLAVGEVDQVVDAAMKAGKVSPAMKDWAIQLGKSNLASLKSFIETAPAIVPLGSAQTSAAGGAAGGAASGKATAALTADEKSVAKMLGVSDEAFAAARAEQRT